MSEKHLQRLCAAIECLCRVHTKEDPEIGFSVIMGAAPSSTENGVTATDYVNAWKAMREIIGMQTEFTGLLEFSRSQAPTGPDGQPSPSGLLEAGWHP